jgi:hypothetical protein
VAVLLGVGEEVEAAVAAEAEEVEEEVVDEEAVVGPIVQIILDIMVC